VGHTGAREARCRHDRTTLPLVQPIVPVLRGVPFDDPAWLFEPKYDGFRGLLYVGPRHCWFRSKRGSTMTRFQGLAEQVRDKLRVRSAILDGEIVSLDEEGRQIFRRPPRRRSSDARGRRHSTVARVSEARELGAVLADQSRARRRATDPRYALPYRLRQLVSTAFDKLVKRVEAVLSGRQRPRP
jgi:hypothetical protein